MNVISWILGMKTEDSRFFLIVEDALKLEGSSSLGTGLTPDPQVARLYGNIVELTSSDPDMDHDYMERMLGSARDCNIEFTSSSQRSHRKKPPSTQQGFSGGAPLEWVTIENITFAAGTIAGITIFAKNVIDIVISWKNLKRNWRTVKLADGNGNVVIIVDDVDSAVNQLISAQPEKSDSL